MGQSNIEKVQQAVVTLSQIQAIQKQQAELFIRDYIASGEKLKDINYFIESNSIDLFLKYFIKCKYRSESKQNILKEDTLKSKIQKNELSLALKIIQSGCSQIIYKEKYLLNELKNIYTSAGSQIVSIREKIKDMIISHLGIESYRYYFYGSAAMRQTNSKILYLYETSQSSQIYKYAKEKLRLKKLNQVQQLQSLSLQQVVKQIYPNSHHYCFQFFHDDTLHIIVYEVEIQKWKYGKCEHQFKVVAILQNIFEMLAKNIRIVYDSQVKYNQIIYKNFFASFTLTILQHIILLQFCKTECLLLSVKCLQYKKQLLVFQQLEQVKQKILNKLTIWRRQIQQSEKKLFLHFNVQKQLQFLYTNEQKSIVFSQVNFELSNLSKCLNYFFPDNKKLVKRINKIVQASKDSCKVRINPNLWVFLCKQRSTDAQSSSVCLLFKLNQNFQSTEEINGLFDSTAKDKMMIRRLKIENPKIAEAGWFKCFLKEENESSISSMQSQRRKNNIKLPKLNRQYRISNFKTLYSLEQLREEIEIQNENLNFLEYSSGKLEVFALKVFSRLDYFKKLPHEKDQFPNFLRQLHFDYQKNDNSFHNFAHAINVMHTCFIFCKANKNEDLLTSFDKFAIIFSGLCHDVGHTGYTNLFEIARQSDLAILYNNKSPLENYHASRTFELLRKNQNNFLGCLNQKQFKKFRELVISSILYTDMKQHFSMIKKFEATKNSTKTEDSLLLAGMIVHASDFAGSVKAFQVCKNWSFLVNKQFSKQYQEEGRLGLPQTPFMKDLNKLSVLAKNESGFLKVIVQPLYKQLSQFYEDRTLNRLVKNVQGNIKQWQKIIATQQNGCENK